MRLIFSESGFVFAETKDGEQAWIPDAVLELESGSSQLAHLPLPQRRLLDTDTKIRRSRPGKGAWKKIGKPWAVWARALENLRHDQGAACWH